MEKNVGFLHANIQQWNNTSTGVSQLLCVASTSNNNIAPTAPTGTAPVSIEEKVVVANDALIVDSVASNIEVAKFHINIEDFEKNGNDENGKLNGTYSICRKSYEAEDNYSGYFMCQPILDN